MDIAYNISRMFCVDMFGCCFLDPEKPKKNPPIFAPDAGPLKPISYANSFDVILEDVELELPLS